MKWAFISTMEGCPWGGSEELWSRVAKRLLEGGDEIHANVRFWPEPARQVTELIAAGTQVTFRRLDRRKTPEPAAPAGRRRLRAARASGQPALAGARPPQSGRDFTGRQF